MVIAACSFGRGKCVGYREPEMPRHLRRHGFSAPAAIDPWSRQESAAALDQLRQARASGLRGVLFHRVSFVVLSIYDITFHKCSSISCNVQQSARFLQSIFRTALWRSG
jgi:hypothetical protein